VARTSVPVGRSLLVASFSSRWLFGFSVFCCFYLCQNLNNDCVLGGATCKRRPEQVACNAGFNAALKWQIGLEQRQGIS